MRLFALRGANCAQAYEAGAILDATDELVRELIASNELTPERMVSCIFTVTDDLNAEFPAVAALWRRRNSRECRSLFGIANKGQNQCKNKQDEQTETPIIVCGTPHKTQDDMNECPETRKCCNQQTCIERHISLTEHVCFPSLLIDGGHS